MVLYLIRFILISFASGVLFSRSRSFATILAKNKLLLGISVAPVLIALNTYVIGLIWRGAPSWVFMLSLPLIATLYLCTGKRLRFVYDKSVETLGKLKNAYLCTDHVLMANDLIAFIMTSIVTSMYLNRHSITNSFLREHAILATIVSYCAIASLCFLLSFFRNHASDIKSISNTVFKIAIIMAMAFSMSAISKQIAHDIGRSIVGHDESHYCIQARIFIEEKNSWDIDNYSGAYEGMVMADDHGPLFPMLIADAYFFSENENHPYTVKLVMVLTGLMFLLSLFNLGSIFGDRRGGLLLILLVLAYKYSIQVLFNGTREPFRFICLNMFVLFFYSYLHAILVEGEHEKQTENRCTFHIVWWGLIVLGISYLSANGHGSNMMVMLCIHLVYTVIWIIKRVSFKEYFVTSAAELIGVCACQYKTIVRFVNTGLTTASTSYYFRDTDVPKLVNEMYAERDIKPLISFLTEYEKGLYVLAFALLMVFVFFAYKSRKEGVIVGERISKETVLLLVAICVILIPLSGVFDAAGYQFRRYLIESNRYRMHYVLFASIILTVSITELIHMLKLDCWRIIFLTVLAICGITLRANINYNDISNERKMKDYYEGICNEIGQETPGIIFVAREIPQFFFRVPTKLSTTEFFHPLYIAKSEKEIINIINVFNIKTFVFDIMDGYYFYYEYLPFFRFLNESPNVIKKRYDYQGYHTIDVYYIDSSAWNKLEGNR